MSELLASKAELNLAMGRHCYTPLHRAVIHGRDVIVSVLLLAKADQIRILNPNHSHKPDPNLTP